MGTIIIKKNANFFVYKGLLSVAASSSFLIAITQRQQVAQIYGRCVYAVTDVALIPISSWVDATNAIAQTKASLSSRDGGSVGAGESSDEDNDDDDDQKAGDNVDDDMLNDDSIDEVDDLGSRTPLMCWSNGNGVGRKDTDSIAEDVIGRRKVRFDRFAASWLGRKLGLGLSGLNNAADAAAAAASSSASSTGTASTHHGSEDVHNRSASCDQSATAENEPSTTTTTTTTSPSKEVLALLRRLLRYTRLLFASRDFFFAYDLDITRPVGAFEPLMTSHLPLYKAVDPLV